MRLRVLLFAGLRERAGAGEVEVEVADGARVADALDQLHGLIGELSVVMAVNREYAEPEVRLHPGDELALIPPISGGSVAAPVHVRVTEEPLVLERLLERVRDPRAGAVVTFSGVTREVDQLDYEAYVEMASRAMSEIVLGAVERFGLCAAAAEHRIGCVGLSESSVLVAVSAVHREQAFAGAREIIDEIKARAPIWKKEEGKWVKGTTPAPGT